MIRFTPEWENHQQNSTSVDFRLHSIEIEAYGAVLRAFVAQSDVLSWVSFACSQSRVNIIGL